MSLFNWLSREKQTKAPGPAGAGAAAPPRAGAPAAPRKSERMANREMLYSVVRESMARAGVLSASYKFKVLSLDAAGRQFLVMVDLAGSERADAELLGDIESVIAQRAKSRHHLTVSGVYWRRSDELGLPARQGGSRQPARGAGAAKASQPAELLPEPPSAPPAPQQQPASAGSFDPIQEDELAALRAALADGLGAAPPATPPRPVAASRPRDEPAASGFQDTVVRRDTDPRSRTLSPTQSGDLN